MKEKIFSNFLKFKIDNKNLKTPILIIGLMGIFLIFISNFLYKQSISDTSKKCKNVQSPEYSLQMQKNLENIISNISGAGNTKVLVTLENGSETIYAKEEKNKESLEDKAKGESSKTKQSDDLEVKYITIKESDGTERALALKELEPIVKGVVVVCEGGNNKDIRSKIIYAIKTALNIPEKRVFVTR